MCRGLAALLAPALAITLSLAADASLGERRFRAAQDLERAGQLEQARELYLQIADSGGESGRADDALLALARLAWPVDDADVLAENAGDTGAVRAARSALATLRERHASGNAAPEGLWRLALTYLVPRAETWDPDEGSALLTTLPVLYPEAPEVPRALALAASLHAAAGRGEQARDLAFRLLTEHPGSERAPRAWLVLAMLDAHAGRAGDALRAFGRAAIDGAATDARAAGRARDLATILDRVTHGPGRPGPSWALVAGGVPLGVRVSDIAATPGGGLAAVSERDELVVSVDATGASRQRRALPGATAVAIDAGGRTWLATETTIVPPLGPTMSIGERREIVSMASPSPGRTWVVDRKAREVLLMDGGADAVLRATLPERAVPKRVARSERGGAWILTERPAALLQVAADGKPTRTIGLESLVRDGADFDVDALGHLYVLDARGRTVVVLMPDGTVVERVALPEGDAGIERPEAIAVDGSGGIAIADGRTRRVAWLR